MEKTETLLRWSAADVLEDALRGVREHFLVGDEDRTDDGFEVKFLEGDVIVTFKVVPSEDRG